MTGTNSRRTAFRTAFLGMLFALAVGLSFLESLIPPLVPVPGIKPGLSNVVTMYAVFLLGARRAYILAALKALFVLMTRGAVAAALSAAGGVLSVTVMLAILLLSRNRATYAAVSIPGAVAHNVGQLAVAAVILRLDRLLWFYLPALVAAGVAMGLLTGILLRAVMPHLPTLGQPGKR